MSLLAQAPRFSMDEAIAIARERYGIEAIASPLTSERDQNFKLATASGDLFVLKIANASDSPELLEAQNAAMAHLTATGICPRVVPDVEGRPMSLVAGHVVRLVTWLPGVPIGTLAHHPPALLEDIGRCVARIDRAFATFDHPAIHRDFYWDLAQAPRIVRERAGLVTDAGLRAMVEAAFRRFTDEDAPRLSSLRTSAIHNDANEYNVLACDGRVTGIIDFGDMVYGWTVGDLAIAIAYASLDKPDPPGAARAVARGYESEYPLTPAERAVLMGLVRLRLAMSVCIAASQQRERPDDEYLTISQGPIRRTLPLLLEA